MVDIIYIYIYMVLYIYGRYYIYMVYYIYTGISVDSLFDSVEPLGDARATRQRCGTSKNLVTIMASMASAGFPHGLGEGFYRVGRG